MGVSNFDELPTIRLNLDRALSAGLFARVVAALIVLAFAAVR
jgi:hypothetical protein